MSGGPGGAGTSPVRVARFDDSDDGSAPAAQARFDAIGADAEPVAAVAEFTGPGPAPEDAAPVAALGEPRVAAGRTVVLVDHNMHVVGSLADRVTVLQSGAVLAEGPYDEVRTDERVITAYLGQEGGAHHE